ncbi:MAG TPA: fused MFS/spermidine synthase [Candidatus Polarisedimenticolaceae bacterium]
MYLLFFLSGATGLIYQVVWLRQLVLVFGSTLEATSAVLGVFMAGLAAGAWAGGRWMDRRPGASPLRVYGILEIGVAAAALSAAFLLPRVSIPAELGEPSRSAARLLAIAALLLPPTLLMGATLPVLSRRAVRDPLLVGGSVGRLYAVNTFGAVVGTFLAAFVALPSVGLRATSALTIGANVLLGTVAIVASRRTGEASTVVTPPRDPRPANVAQALPLLVFAASGFGAMVLEVAWTRALGLVFGSSVYAFALMLLAFLIGLASGGAGVSAWLRRRPDADGGALLALLLAASAAASFATAWGLQALPGIAASYLIRGSEAPIGWFALQLGLALLVMFPSTFALGGVFPAVLHRCAVAGDGVAGSVGRVYASNTAGTILGALAAGFVLVPRFGVWGVLLGVCALQGALALTAALGTAQARSSMRAVAVGLAVAVIGALAIARPGWDALLMNSGVYYNVDTGPGAPSWPEHLAKLRATSRIVFVEEGRTASVMVVDHLPSRGRYLAVNGKVDASSSADLETQLLMGHLPMLFRPGAKDVLVVGLASGISVGAVAAHPAETIRVVEVERAMVRAAREFARWNGDVLDDRRVEVVVDDARHFLRRDRGAYDVIVSQPSNPWMTVAANLFTREFFEIGRSRLRPGGVFGQWIQLYGLRPEDVASVVAAFRSSFPSVMLFSTMGGVDLVLLGSETPLRFDTASLDAAMSELRVRMSLGRVGIHRSDDLLPLFRVGDAEVDSLLGGAVTNSDDNGRVEFRAPKAMQLQTIDANAEWLCAAGSDPVRYLRPEPPADDADRRRLAIADRRFRRGETIWGIASARLALQGRFRSEATEMLRGQSVQTH